MYKSYCGRCGSRILVADRALGGRIVCAKCGSSHIKKDNISLNVLLSNQYSGKLIKYILLTIFIIFILISLI